MNTIQFSYGTAVSAEAVSAYKQSVATAQDQLVHATGLGNDFLGWVTLPEDYDKEEFEKAMAWTEKYCKVNEGYDYNADKDKAKTREEKDADWEFTVKNMMIIRDLMQGNPKLREMGFKEEALGHNAILAGVQGQRQWTDWLPNADFAESILNSTFDWNGKKQPTLLATENDGLNGTAMLFGNLLSGRASIFADVRTYWSPEAVKAATGYDG